MLIYCLVVVGLLIGVLGTAIWASFITYWPYNLSLTLRNYDFGTFDQTYGSLGAVIGFMIWLWISAIVILLGAELNAEMEHQTTVDTTKGPSRPIGTRDATVADEVGAATS